MLHSKIAVFLLAFGGLASAAAIKEKRDNLVTTIYAYGTNITGLSVFFVDSLAYIGTSTPEFANVAANITFSTDTDSSSPWTVIANTTTTNSTVINGSSLYIITTAASTAQVGFVGSNGTLPTGAVTTGFSWFGKQVAYIADEANIEMQFWAVPTNTTGLWSLVWNTDGGLIDYSTPVALKSTAPLYLDLAKRSYEK